MDVMLSAKRMNFYQRVRGLLRQGYSLENELRFISPLSLESYENNTSEVRESTPGHFEIEVANDGLTGVSGALPVAYTEWLIERFYRYGDTSAKDFLDIFTHRLQSLRYRSWLYSHAYARAEYEGVYPLAREIASLSGTLHQSGLLQSQRHAFLPGLGVRSMKGLEQWLALFIGSGVSITPFHGCWRQVDTGMQARVGGHSLTLGMAPMLGQMYHDIQSGFSLSIGPIRQADIDNFLPGKPFFKTIQQRVEAWLGPGLDMVVELLIDAKDSTPLILGTSRLGFDCCLSQSAPGKLRTMRIADVSTKE